MAFLVSPGVQVKEIDLTNVVPAVSSSIGAIAGSFQWGPADVIQTVGSEEQLVSVFGKPNDDTFSTFLTASQFLAYANSLRVVRKVGSSALNAGDGGSGSLIKNDDDAQVYAGVDNLVAKYPGVIGNSIIVEICPADSGAFAGWASKGNFNSAPGTSAQAEAFNCSNDEMHIVVADANGIITGTAGTILETYSYVSQASDAKSSDGTSNYWKNVVNSQSNWIRVTTAFTSEFADSGTAFTAMGGTTGNVVAYNTAPASSGAGSTSDTTLSGGVSDDILSVGLVTDGMDMFSDAETVEISLLMNGAVFSGADHVTACNKAIAIAEGRKDTVAFVSPATSDSISNPNAAADIITWRSSLTSSSYAFADSSALYVYDKYNDTYRWVPASGSMAGLAANADLVADAWFSPAGFTRGNIRNVTKLAFNPKQVERDDLYKNGINPLVSFPGAGTLLYGDKTLQYKASAFDRINVRRLFIVLEKAISRASKASLFEFNDEFTRAQFRNMVEPFLRDVKGRRGVTDFKVVCDDTNNTGDIIDTNRFVADIYIKPARSINFITLNFIATRTGVEFSEIAGGN